MKEGHMSFQRIETVTGTAVHVPGDDIDTDRIIPGRFLRCVTFDGLGEYAFYDERFSTEGVVTTHPLNDARFAGAKILLTGRNFGCGSSREHAPQSLQKAGFRAIIGESFAEIFFGNATTLGLVCVAMSGEAIEKLSERVAQDPGLEVTVDLEGRCARVDDGFLEDIQIPEAARDALLRGQWDPLSQLLESTEQVAAAAASLPYMTWSE